MGSLHKNVKNVVAKLLKVLSDRNKDAVSRRFGLKTGKKETLESIGRSYSITRERVRQIESVSLKQIKDSLKMGLASLVEPYVTLAGSILEEHGGAMKESDLFEKFSGSRENNPVNAALVFFLNLQDKFARESEDDEHNTFWAVNAQYASSCKNAIADFIKALTKKGSISENKVVDFYNKNISIKDVSPKFVASQLSISKQIGKNSFGQIGLTSWPEIKPRGVKDKAYLILKRDNKPCHFREIAELINSQGEWSKVANIQTVHNELIKDKRFVLVGRGMYALREWGYKAGTVKDVVRDVLSSSKEKMSRGQIVEQVMVHRIVKPNTIVLALQDQKYFIKNSDDTYSLKEA